MTKVNANPLQHEVHYEREVMELPSSNGWRERALTANARASCTCGGLDTGFVDVERATVAAREHVARYLPGVPFDGPAPERPVGGEETTT